MSEHSKTTNYERIKNMSLKELAEELHKIDEAGVLVCSKYKCRKIIDTDSLDCVSCYVDWLNEVVEQ